MTVSLEGGVFTIDGKEVLTAVFKDGTTMRFPTERDDSLIVADPSTQSIAGAVGYKNTAISGKNIVAPGSVISCKGDFRVGDG